MIIGARLAFAPPFAPYSFDTTQGILLAMQQGHIVPKIDAMAVYRKPSAHPLLYVNREGRAERERRNTTEPPSRQCAPPGLGLLRTPATAVFDREFVHADLACFVFGGTSILGYPRACDLRGCGCSCSGSETGTGMRASTIKGDAGA